MGTELFHVEGRTDIHDDSNSRFSNFADAPKNGGYVKPNKAIWQEPGPAGIPRVPGKTLLLCRIFCVSLADGTTTPWHDQDGEQAVTANGKEMGLVCT